MKHPQILLLPLLMLADYFLTVWGAVLKDKGYGNHFRVEHYELNPVWQKSISQKRWINPRHILITFLTTGALAVLLEWGEFPDDASQGLFGCLFVFYGIVVGRHLSNILIFRRFVRYPGEMSGQVVMAHSLALRISTFQYLVVAIPIGMTAIFSPTPFTLGGAVGAVLIFVVHTLWIWRHKRASNTQGGTNGRQTLESETNRRSAEAESHRAP